MWYWWKGQASELNRKESKIEPHKYGLFDLTKVQRQFEEIGIVFSTHGIGIIGYFW